MTEIFSPHAANKAVEFFFLMFITIYAAKKTIACLLSRIAIKDRKRC
jgi:hypothetical protein